MTCSKKACPVLQCTLRGQYHPPGECCPVCRGTRSLMNVANRCLLQDSLMWENHKLYIDKCTNCTCRNETSICKRAACPVLDCAPDLQKSVPGSCCKQCIMPEEVKTQCSHDGKYYEASWWGCKKRNVLNYYLLGRMVSHGNLMNVVRVRVIGGCQVVRRQGVMWRYLVGREPNWCICKGSVARNVLKVKYFNTYIS